MNFPATTRWQCGNRQIELKKGSPFLLGILNVTPDSFSDGGEYAKVDAAVRRGLELGEAGDGVDVGGESTRPGAKAISAKEERQRVIPVLRQLRKERPEVLLSVDTYKSEVARAAWEEAGVEVVNDVGGGNWDGGMWDWVATTKVGYVCMHAKGKPSEMQKNPIYENVGEEVGRFLQERMEGLAQKGIAAERVLLDVGIGFGKTAADNQILLRKEWGELGRPMLWGLSRKSFLGLTEKEKSLPNRDEALAWWHRELMAKNKPMVWRVHDPARVRASLES